MKPSEQNFLHTLLSVLSISVLLYSCSPAAEGSGGSTRKKLPEFYGGDGIEGFGLAVSNISMDFNGGNQGFISVALPDASNDSLAIELLHRFGVYAPMLISNWETRSKCGVAIDLGSHSGGAHRTDYLLESPGAFSIPVIVNWDRASVNRLIQLQGLVAEMPGVKLRCVAGFDPAARK